MNQQRADQLSDRVTNLLLEHPVASTMFAVLAQLLIIDVLGRLDLEYGRLNAFGYIALADSAISTLVVLLLPRWTKQTPAQVIILRWAIAGSPFLLAFVSAMSEGPEWLLGPGFVLTTALLIYSMRAAKSTQQRAENSEQS